MLDLFSLLPLSAARDKEGCLTIAGHSLRALAEQFGTPLYLYDDMTFTSQVSRLHSALKQYYQGDSQVTYAAKAYLSLAFGRHLVEKGLGIEVASLGEMALARRAGFPAKQIHLHGNNKTAAELAASLEYGLYAIVVDSLDELDLLEALANESKSCAPIWLRISPDVQVDTHSFLQTAHASSKFGFRIQDGQAGEAIERARASRWLQLTGFHTHLGSQLHQTEPYRQAIQRYDGIGRGASIHPSGNQHGGGWGVPYITDQAEDDPQSWIQTIASTVQEECVKRGWPLPALVVEPGRWLVARAGVALYTVGAIKTTVDEHRLVAVDGGMADNPRRRCTMRFIQLACRNILMLLHGCVAVWLVSSVRAAII